MNLPPETDELGIWNQDDGRGWAIAGFAVTALLAFGLNLAARVFAEQHRYRKGDRL